ncbi:hypothetical protein [Marinomonas shanghaiensis]|uniref:hypothetical protein n=1 Tax=Marinomonas shanghaiensis TaxID=2202418 RepID=UPI003A8E2580
MKNKIKVILIDSLMGKSNFENIDSLASSLKEDENIIDRLAMDSLDAFEFYISIQEHFSQLRSISSIINYLTNSQHE